MKLNINFFLKINNQNKIINENEWLRLSHISKFDFSLLYLQIEYCFQEKNE